MKITKIEDLNNILEGITELDISSLGLTTLPKLAMGPEGPDAVKKDARVFCSLPQSLTGLYCWNNKLTSLDNLPSGLTILICSNNELTILDNLPQSLTRLICSDNKLTSLDNLPQGLTRLFCGKNNLKSLNNLPQGLIILLCSHNKLTILNNLPTSLKHLNCSHNKLTILNNLPQSLTKLKCSNNNLIILDIENCNDLGYFCCNDNNFPEEMVTILDDEDLTIQEKINKLIEECLIPNDNSFVLK